MTAAHSVFPTQPNLDAEDRREPCEYARGEHEESAGEIQPKKKSVHWEDTHHAKDDGQEREAPAEAWPAYGIEGAFHHVHRRGLCSYVVMTQGQRELQTVATGQEKALPSQ